MHAIKRIEITAADGATVSVDPPTEKFATKKHAQEWARSAYPKAVSLYIKGQWTTQDGWGAWEGAICGAAAYPELEPRKGVYVGRFAENYDPMRGGFSVSNDAFRWPTEMSFLPVPVELRERLAQIKDATVDEHDPRFYLPMSISGGKFVHDPTATGRLEVRWHESGTNFNVRGNTRVREGWRSDAIKDGFDGRFVRVDWSTCGALQSRECIRVIGIKAA